MLCAPVAEGGSRHRGEVCACSQLVFAPGAGWQPAPRAEQMLAFGEKSTRISDFKTEW